MQFLVGTSGYSYPKWKGSFYPQKLPAKEMLHFYAQRFSTVEANNTFYRMPTADVLRAWSEQVPNSFQFVLKAPQRITHIKRLKDVKEDVRELLRTSAALKKKRGPIFFQLPPNFKKDVARLEGLLRGIGKRVPARSSSAMRVGSMTKCLTACASTPGVCLVDAEDSPNLKPVSTANWGYVRLRRERYTAKQLSRWIETLKSQPWDKAYVFFKHEDIGTGPKFVRAF